MLLRSQVLVPIIVSCALLMQQLDSTAVATSLPAMSRSLSVSVLHLHVAITAYLFALAIFLPLTGWTADRFGQRFVFCASLATFCAGSVLCALSSSLPELVAARILQGFGGSLMVPVARLILIRSVPKADLISALALMSMTAIIGPAAGPLLGGSITTFGSWRWIFWINVPVGILGIVMTLLCISEVRTSDPRPFDLRGLLMTSAALGAIMYWVNVVSTQPRFSWPPMALLAFGLILLWFYARHSRTLERPILDLGLFRYTTFRVSVLGGSLFRIGFGALPFMLPLLMQEELHYSALQSGAITFVSAVGSFGMRTVVRRILRVFGFRQALIWNALISNLFLASCALFGPGTPRVAMMATLFLGGVSRALELTSLNAIAYVEVSTDQMSDATTLTQIAQRISQSLGVALAAFLLALLGGGTHVLPLRAFSETFVIVAVVSTLSAISFLRLPHDAGAEMTLHGAGAASRTSEARKGSTVP